MAKLPHGPRIEIPLSKSVQSNELEQQVMASNPLRFYEAPPLTDWAIFYPESEQYLFNRFHEVVRESFETFNWPAKEAIIVPYTDLVKSI